MRRIVVLPFVAAMLLVPAAAGQQPSTLPRLAPPPDGQSYFGFTFLLWNTTDPVWGDARPLAERIGSSIQTELAGKTPTFLTVWAPWQDENKPGYPYVPFSAMLPDVAKVRSVVGDQGVIYLDWNIASTTPAAGITTKDIAAGRADRYIREYAKEVRAYGRALLIRLLNGEFNGSWWSGVSPKANIELTTEDFVRAWRRVVDIFRAVGASNVSWAWVPNAFPPETGSLPGVDKNLDAYWPGDEYVDWAGADVYDVGPVSWLDPPYAFAAAHHKPFFVAEFGVRHEWSGVPPGQWSVWLADAFAWFASHPSVKAIAYFNLNNRHAATRVQWNPAADVLLDSGRVRYTPNVNDHDSRLLAAGPDAQALFAANISTSRYVSSVATEQVGSTPIAPTAAMLPAHVRGRFAILAWKGNLAADTFDVAVRGARGGWKLVAATVPRATFRLRGTLHARLLARVRPHDVYGTAGGWSAAVSVVF